MGVKAATAETEEVNTNLSEYEQAMTDNKKAMEDLTMAHDNKVSELQEAHKKNLEKIKTLEESKAADIKTMNENKAKEIKALTKEITTLKESIKQITTLE